MNEETRTALENSIAHWRRMATGTEKEGEAPKSAHCALCLAFYFHGRQCDDCPVFARTGHRVCISTPYGAAMDAWMMWQSGCDTQKNKKAFQAAAQKELEFLESLLPAEEAA